MIFKSENKKISNIQNLNKEIRINKEFNIADSGERKLKK